MSAAPVAANSDVKQEVARSAVEAALEWFAVRRTRGPAAVLAANVAGAAQQLRIAVEAHRLDEAKIKEFGGEAYQRFTAARDACRRKA